MKTRSTGFLIAAAAAALIAAPAAMAQPAAHVIAADNHSGGSYAGGATSASLSKFAGGTEVWTLQLGADPSASVLALAQSADGAIYAAGSQGARGGGFIARVSPAGERLGFQSLPAPARAVAVDPRNGNVYAAGDGYLALYQPDLSAQIHGGLIGGTATGIALDGRGGIYVAFASGGMGKVAALRDAGESGFPVTWTVDLGAAVPAAIALDATGTWLAVAGAATSPKLVTRHAAQPRLDGPSDAFAAKLTAAGELLWSTYLGGRGPDAATFVAIDAETNWIAVGGSTASPDFPKAGGPWNGGEDGFVSWLDNDGKVMESLYTGAAGRERVHLTPREPPNRISAMPVPARAAKAAAARATGNAAAGTASRAATATANVSVGTNPFSVVVNPVTNKIYVLNYWGANVTVIDGGTNAISAVSVGVNPVSVAVNPVTNKIYVANYGSNNVTVINGAANTTATVTVGTNPFAVAVNPVTNKIYIANSGSNNVTVIDGATNATATVSKIGRASCRERV